jgi:hypothetical protein
MKNVERTLKRSAARRGIYGLMLAVAAVVATPASAVAVSSIFGAPDPGSPGESLLVDFNSASVPAGYSLSGDYSYATGTSGSAAAPSGDTTQYFYVSSAIPNGSATLSTPDLTSVSLYWGSIDTYNSVDVLLSGGGFFHIGGAAFPPANGDQLGASTNRRVFFTAEGSELITGLRFNSSGVAFELDDIYGNLAGGGTGSDVPEPQSWMLMIAGFGMVGLATRRRRGFKVVEA